MRTALQRDISSKLPGKFFRDRQSQPVALNLTVSGILHRKKTLKYMIRKSRIDPLSLIRHIDKYLPVIHSEKQPEIFAVRPVPCHIGEQIRQNALNKFLIPLYIDRSFRQINFHLKLPVS